jgi:hypothetical protein
VLGGRVCGRVVSTLTVCSVAKCKYPFRINKMFMKSTTEILDEEKSDYL